MFFLYCNNIVNSLKKGESMMLPVDFRVVGKNMDCWGEDDDEDFAMAVASAEEQMNTSESQKEKRKGQTIYDLDATNYSK